MTFPILERVASISAPGIEPMFSNYGYIFLEDGTTYTLLRQFMHGFILACIFPDQFREWVQERSREYSFSSSEEDLEFPENVEDINVMAFQGFEIDKARELKVVQIANSLAGLRLSFPYEFDEDKNINVPILTKAQRDQVLIVFNKVYDSLPRAQVFTDIGDTKVGHIRRCFNTDPIDYTIL